MQYPVEGLRHVDHDYSSRSPVGTWHPAIDPSLGQEHPLLNGLSYRRTGLVEVADALQGTCQPAP